MAKLKLTCPECSKVTNIDSAKVPDRPVRFSCPGCGTKIVIDKKKLMEESSAEPAPSPPKQSSETSSTKKGRPPRLSGPPKPASPSTRSVSSDDALQSEEALTTTTVLTPSGKGSAEPQLSKDATDMSLLGSESCDVTIPSGIVVGEDESVVQRLQQSLSKAGSTLAVVPAAQLASHLRERIPPLIVVVAGEVHGPPCDMLDPLRELTPSERRSTFVVLVAKGLRTLDGSASFFYEVNMTLSQRDLAKAEDALKVGLDYHTKLYRPYRAAVAAAQQ